MGIKNKTLISYFGKNASSEELEQITRINFSEIDIKSEDISRAMKNFKNLKEIYFRFGPFEKYFPHIPNNMPNIILKDYTHGEKHIKFLLEFAKKCKSVTFIEREYYGIHEYLKKHPELAKRFVFSGTTLINLEQVYDADLAGKTLQVNTENIELIPEEILKKANKVIFSGNIGDVKKLSRKSLKKIDDIILTINNASELSIQKIKWLIQKQKLPIKQVQIYSEDNSVQQNIPYDLENYKEIRAKLDKLVKGIPDSLSDEKKFAEIYKRVATYIKYDCEQYSKENINFINSRNMINAILNGKTVCSGYADVLKNALSLKSIESIKMSGEVKKDGTLHEWNKVKINGNWYNVDVTWDRYALREGEIPEFALISDEECKKTRIEMMDMYTPISEKSYTIEELKRIFEITVSKNIIVQGRESGVSTWWDLSIWENGETDFSISVQSSSKVNNQYIREK